LALKRNECQQLKVEIGPVFIAVKGKKSRFW